MVTVSDPLPDGLTERSDASLTFTGDRPASDSHTMDTDGYFESIQTQCVTRVKAARPDDYGIAKMA